MISNFPGVSCAKRFKDAKRNGAVKKIISLFILMADILILF